MESIVLRGKHPEDVDEYTWFVYSGVGGCYRRVRDSDQTFDKGELFVVGYLMFLYLFLGPNSWFLENMNHGTPVRVIRKSLRRQDTGTSRLVYSGLYHPVYKMQSYLGKYLICKFIFVHAKDWDPDKKNELQQQIWLSDILKSVGGE